MIVESDARGACRSCAGGLTEAAWRELPLARTMTASIILQHVSAWPAPAYIEVRCCRDCGRSIARMVRGELIESLPKT